MTGRTGGEGGKARWKEGREGEEKGKERREILVRTSFLKVGAYGSMLVRAKIKHDAVDVDGEGHVEIR